jgi:hypothetical protein
MADYSLSRIDQVIIHHIGHKGRGGSVAFSRAFADISQERVKRLLHTFFFRHFDVDAYYRFSFPTENFRLNPVYQIITAYFENREDLFNTGVDLAKLLFDVSEHPLIKDGDFFIVHFSNLPYGHQRCDGLGLFKCESQQAFLKLLCADDEIQLQAEEGIHPEKPDKACLILHTEKEDGYRVLCTDKTNAKEEALYWKDSFLQLQPCADAYHQTRHFLADTRMFMQQEVTEQGNMSRTDQIDLWNRSVNFFKSNTQFRQADFELEVMQDPESIAQFRSFRETQSAERGIPLSGDFEISDEAVKRQARLFKSVLKLDRNFHVYIHGDRSMIESGVDADGRKFYKIYYEEER